MFAADSITVPATALSVIITALLGGGSIFGLFLRSLFKYLFDRITVLEAREAERNKEGGGAVQALVSATKDQSETIKTIGDYVATLVKDREYMERRRREQFETETRGTT